MSTKLWYLSQSRLFEGLPQTELEALDRVTRIALMPKFAPIYLPGDQADCVYLLKRGQVRISRLHQDGKQVVLSILGPGDIFGELVVAGESQRSEVAEAMEATMLCVMHRQDFENVLRHQPDVHLKLTRLIGLRLNRIESRVEDLVFRSASQRLAHLVLMLAEQYGIPHPEGTRINLRLTQQDMANLLGLSRQTVSLTLNDWKEAGWLLSARGHLVVKNAQPLKEIDTL